MVALQGNPDPELSPCHVTLDVSHCVGVWMIHATNDATSTVISVTNLTTKGLEFLSCFGG